MPNYNIHVVFGMVLQNAWLPRGNISAVIEY